MGKIIRFLSIILFILISGAWSVCALYFGDSNSGMLELCLASAFGLLAVATLISLAFPNWRKDLLIVYALAFITVLVWWLSISPSNQREWQQDVAKLAAVEINGDKVTVRNVRNFSYHSEFDYQPAYYDKTYDLNKLEGIDLISVYWMGQAIAHTMLSFHFGGNDYLAVSIEARKELDEGYSTIKGFFRQYELIYIVADERDVLRLRTNYRKDPPEQVYVYRIQGGDLERARNMFLEYAREINRLNIEPEFYNTLLDNCTTAIWLRSRINPQHLNFSWKILLSGYVPEYMYESGRLDTSVPFAELQRQAHINSRAQAADQAADFSTLIRKPLPILN